MNGRPKKNRKCSLPILFLISLLSIVLFMPTVLADSSMKASFDPVPSAEPPVISNVYPANGSTGVGLQITCHIKVSDDDGDSLNVTWYSSTDGLIFNPEEIDSGVNSGDTVYWTYTDAASYDTLYYWKVDVDDGTFTTTAIYHFTTTSLGGGPPYHPPEEEPRVNEKPIANITGPRNGYVGQSLVFYGGYSYDPDGYIIGYRWDFTNDGLFDTDWQEDEFVSHIYSSPGDYTVKLQVQDNDSATATDSYVITIGEVDPDKQLPVAEANGPYEGLVNETISFNATGSYDPDGIIVTYIWDFGDHNTSQLKNPVHVYAKLGNYTAVLTVIDNNGLTNMDIATVYVKTNETEGPGEEPGEERELPLSLLTMLIIGIIATMLIVLLFKRKRKTQKGRRITEKVQTTKRREIKKVESKVDRILFDNIEAKVDKILIDDMNLKVDTTLVENKTSVADKHLIKSQRKH